MSDNNKMFGSMLSRGVSWSDFVQSYFSNKNKSSNRLRNLLVGALGINVAETSMRNDVAKNLEDLETEKTFELAKLTEKYNAYNNLWTDEENFQQDKNYWNIKAEQDFASINPNFDLTLEDARNKRQQEIDEKAKWYQDTHNSRMQQGLFYDENNKLVDGVSRLTKEEFEKPLNDFYDSRKADINAPRNKSIVHSAWSKGKNLFVTDEERQRNAEKISSEKTAATRTSLTYLLDPTDISSQEDIAMFRNPKGFTYTSSEAIDFVTQSMPNSDALPNIIRAISSEKRQAYTHSDLQNLIVTEVTEFDPLLEDVKSYGNLYDSNWMAENNAETIPPEDSDLYNDYRQGKSDYIALKSDTLSQSGYNVKNLIRLRNTAERNEDKELVAIYQAQINNYTKDDIKQAIILESAEQWMDPDVRDDFHYTIGVEEPRDFKKHYKEWVKSRLELYEYSNEVFEEILSK
jgi:hypothetical protein